MKDRSRNVKGEDINGLLNPNSSLLTPTNPCALFILLVIIYLQKPLKGLFLCVFCSVFWKKGCNLDIGMLKYF